jgi:heptosyltransferase-3
MIKPIGADARKILILMTDRHIGNLVLSLPALVALQNLYRDKPHYFVIDEGFRDLVETVLDPEHTLFYPRRSIKHGNPMMRAMTYFGFLRKLKTFSADLLIDLTSSRNSGLLSRSSSAKVRVARKLAKRPSLYTDLIELNDSTHKVYDYTDIAAAVGASIDQGLFHYEPEAQKFAQVKRRLSTAEIDFERPLVSIHIGAGRIQKLWNVSEFIRVTDWLTEQGCQVVFVGAPAETQRANEVITQLDRPVLNLVGEIALGELLGLLKLSTAYLGNDSGPMHMAAAMGTPGVAMFSYARESEWGPRSDKFKLLRGQEICKVCIKKKCLDPVCINTLDTAPVIRSLASILNLEVQPTELKGSFVSRIAVT